MKLPIAFLFISLFFLLPVIASAQDLVISYEEIVTLTDTEIVITWVTNKPSDTTITYWEDSEGEKISVTLEENVTCHWCRLTGLQPGTTYHYYISSGGVQGKPLPRSPGIFMTFEPPGEYLFSFATMNDLQIGTPETFIPGLYLRSAIDTAQWACNDLDEQSITFTIIKGDITGLGKKEELLVAKRTFDRLDSPYYLIPSWLDVAGEIGTRNDSIFKEVFGLNQTYYSFDHEVNGSKFRFICLDSAYNPFPFDLGMISEGSGHIPKEEMDWLEAELEESTKEGIPVFIFLRTPLQPNLSSFMLGLPLTDYSQLVGLLRRHNVWGVFSGSYIHRNYAHRSPLFPYPWVETSSVVESPMGYNIYKVYTEGYIQAFYKINDLPASEKSRLHTWMGLGDYLLFGTLSDRNFVWRAK